MPLLLVRCKSFQDICVTHCILFPNESEKVLLFLYLCLVIKLPLRNLFIVMFIAFIYCVNSYMLYVSLHNVLVYVSFQMLYCRRKNQGVFVKH